MTGIEKRFGPIQANHGASLEVGAGEIHAVVGENGAGKSTLMRILAGFYAPDVGKVEVNGRDVTGWTTADAIRAGVGMVHQHFMLIPTLTVAENVILGREPRRGFAIDMARALLEVKGVAEQVGFPMDVRRLVRELSVGEEQRVEILKAIFRGARILILDEPTAVLSPPEVRELWRVLRSLRDGGGTIILITHKLEEVTEISDHLTVMRHGQTVARMSTHETTPAELARLMVGREVRLAGLGTREAGLGNSSWREELSAHVAPSPQSRVPSPESRTPALALRHLIVPSPRHARAVDDVSLTVEAGEILGIAGVEGNGQSELVEAIAGLRKVTSGAVLLGDRNITTLDVRTRSRLGLAHIPEDRHRRGLVLDYSVADNLILGRQEHFARGPAGARWVLDRTRVEANARVKIEQFEIRPPDPSLPVRALSGGNQQKVVIAREMGAADGGEGDFAVLLAAQPTRGVDVGAIEFIHGRLAAARAAGKAILLVSAELTEILALADRVAVMYGGKIVAVVPRAEASEEMLGPLMMGVRNRTSAA